MNPDHLKLAIEEYSLLKSQGLIGDTISQWAYEAFYVKKNSRTNQRNT